MIFLFIILSPVSAASRPANSSISLQNKVHGEFLKYKKHLKEKHESSSSIYTFSLYKSCKLDLFRLIWVFSSPPHTMEAFHFISFFMAMCKYPLLQENVPKMLDRNAVLQMLDKMFLDFYDIYIPYILIK